MAIDIGDLPPPGPQSVISEAFEDTSEPPVCQLDWPKPGSMERPKQKVALSSDWFTSGSGLVLGLHVQCHCSGITSLPTRLPMPVPIIEDTKVKYSVFFLQLPKPQSITGHAQDGLTLDLDVLKILATVLHLLSNSIRARPARSLQMVHCYCNLQEVLFQFLLMDKKKENNFSGMRNVLVPGKREALEPGVDGRTTG